MSPQSWKTDTAKAQSIHLKLLRESFSLQGGGKKSSNYSNYAVIFWFSFIISPLPPAVQYIMLHFFQLGYF